MLLRAPNEPWAVQRTGLKEQGGVEEGREMSAKRERRIGVGQIG